MTLIEVRNRFHTLIDEVDNPQLLERFLEIMQQSIGGAEAKLWVSLTDEERNGVLAAYEESKNEASLIAHENVMQKYGKWLKK